MANSKHAEIMDALKSGLSPREIAKMQEERDVKTPLLQIYDVQSMKQRADLEKEFVQEAKRIVSA